MWRVFSLSAVHSKDSCQQHLTCFGVIPEVNHVFGCFQGKGAAEGEEEEETGVVPGTEGWLTGFLCFQP